MKEQLEMLLADVDAADCHAFASNSCVAKLNRRCASKENNSHQTNDKVELCYHGMVEPPNAKSAAAGQCAANANRTHPPSAGATSALELSFACLLENIIKRSIDWLGHPVVRRQIK